MKKYVEFTQIDPNNQTAYFCELYSGEAMRKQNKDIKIKIIVDGDEEEIKNAIQILKNLDVGKS